MKKPFWSMTQIGISLLIEVFECNSTAKTWFWSKKRFSVAMCLYLTKVYFTFRVPGRQNFWVSPLKQSPFKTPHTPGQMTPRTARLFCFGEANAVSWLVYKFMDTYDINSLFEGLTIAIWVYRHILPVISVHNFWQILKSQQVLLFL